MAIAHATGTWYGSYAPGTNGTTGNFNITVPSDTNCLIVYVSTYADDTNWITGGAYGVTAGGNSPTAVASLTDDSATAWQGGGWAFITSLSGTVNIAWTFGSSYYNHLFAWVAYKGVSEVRGGPYGTQVGSGSKSVLFTAQSGDLISSSVTEYTNGPTTATWTNATNISNYTASYSLISIAEASPSGNVTVSSYFDVTADGGLAGFVLIPIADSTGQPTSKRFGGIPFASQNSQSSNRW